MKNITKKNMGSVIIIALGMGFVLTIGILALRSFTSHRVLTTNIELSRVKALTIAEAGLELALTELMQNNAFQTHELLPDLSWQTERDREQTIESPNNNFGFTLQNRTRGTYMGTIGKGEFRVRIGNIPFTDDPSTLNVDESKAYLKIESVGRFGTTVRRIEAVVNRRFPAKEFLMYDGGTLSIVFGEPGDMSGYNVFSTGHLYGHEGIEIGRILTSSHNSASPGTRQKIKDMNAMISGAGGIFIFSDLEAEFRARKTVAALNTTISPNAYVSEMMNGVYTSTAARKNGEYPEALRGTTPTIPSDVKPWLFDRNDGVSIPPTPVPFASYKQQASSGGLYISSGATQYKMPSDWTGSTPYVKATIIDFGTNIRDGNTTLPAGFNGVIYSEDDIVIKGNPPQDLETLTIVSEKNVFLAGDFNQAGDPSKHEEAYGMPQVYTTNALVDSDYASFSKDRLIADATAPSGTFRHHIPASVVAKHRIVYDYRSPMDCFENEIYPLLKHELAKEIADQAAADSVLDRVTQHSAIVSTAADKDEFKTKVEAFFTKYPMNDSKQTTLIDDIVNRYESNSGQFDYAAFNEIGKNIWKTYREVYEPNNDGSISTAAQDADNFGVYKLLYKLRETLGVGGGGKNEVTNPSSITQPGNFLYYPEITVNAMLISAGKLNNLCYAGADYSKVYNKIGCASKIVAANMGVAHSKMSHMVHRVYGSQMNLRQYDVQRLETGGFYIPPIRRKIYDETLPRTAVGSNEFAQYVVLSWHDYGANEAYFSSF